MLGKTRIHAQPREIPRRVSSRYGDCCYDNALSVSQLQIIFTGAETYDNDEPNIHGGAMWARMPITALVGDTPLQEWPEPMPVYAAQPWDCSSREHSVYVLDRATPCPWIAKIDGEFYPARYMFTVDYTENEIADDPAQHKQSHVMELLDAGPWTGNIVALPNNRVRVTSSMVGGRRRRTGFQAVTAYPLLQVGFGLHAGRKQDIRQFIRR